LDAKRINTATAFSAVSGNDDFIFDYLKHNERAGIDLGICRFTDNGTSGKQESGTYHMFINAGRDEFVGWYATKEMLCYGCFHQRTFKTLPASPGGRTIGY